MVKTAPGSVTLLDHPLLTMDMAGAPVFLEPDLIVCDGAGNLTIVEVKSFAVIDGQADSAKVAAAAIQSAVYALALRQTLEDLGFDPDLVPGTAVLVCPRDFTNQPVATTMDIRKHLAVVSRQLARMRRIESLVAELPSDWSLDLALDASGTAHRPADEIVEALADLRARYVPGCLSTCELATFCRAGARDATATLGSGVREHLGGIDSVSTVLAVTAGVNSQAEVEVDAASLLRDAFRLRCEALAVSTGGLP